METSDRNEERIQLDRKTSEVLEVAIRSSQLARFTDPVTNF